LILLSSFLILNSINPELLNIELEQLECPSGIGVVKKTILGKIANDCISSDMKNIEGDILEPKSGNFLAVLLKKCIYATSQILKEIAARSLMKRAKNILVSLIIIYQ